MNRLTFLFFALPLSIFAKTFVINPRDNTTVDVSQQGNMLKVICRFPGNDKFGPAINAKLNDSKGDQLFLEGLLRYFKAGSSESLEFSGKHILGVKKGGSFLSYTYAVPKSSCKIVQNSQPSVVPVAEQKSVGTPQSPSSLMNQTSAVKQFSMLGMSNPESAVTPFSMLGLSNPVATIKPLPMLEQSNPLPIFGPTNQASKMK